MAPSPSKARRSPRPSSPEPFHQRHLTSTTARITGTLGGVTALSSSTSSAGADEQALATATSETKRRLAGFGEFLLVGGATLFLFPLSWIARRAFGWGEAELAIGFLAFYGATVINDPHFSVTYLLFYKNARKRALSAEYSAGQRARYWISGLLVPLALVTWAIAALAYRSAEAIGWMVQLMFLLVGWHYVKQGFGMFVVLSARQKSRLSARERLVTLAHCFAGWAFAWSNPASPAREYEEKGVVYHGLAHPRALEIATGLVLLLTTIALVVVLAAKRRRREPIAYWPLLGLLITVWSWTIFSSIDPLVRYVIPALHSIQYLYFVWLMKKNEARSEEGEPHFGRPVAVRVGFLALSAIALGWLFFKGAPGFLDGSILSRSHRLGPDAFDAMGETPYFAALYTIVNIHHYFMDHVIWRRENPETRYLHM